ncbi:MAG: hypothetical protein ACOH12_09150 [Parvibaculaceae bacterium]
MKDWRHSTRRRQSAVLLAMLCVVMLSAGTTLPVPDVSPTLNSVSGQKKISDPRALDALLNRVPAAPTVSSPAGSGRSQYDYDRSVDNSGPTPPLTTTEIDMFRVKLNTCFDAAELAADPKAGTFYAVLRFQLAKNGTVIGTPEIEDTGPGKSEVLADMASEAILRCAPYNTMPKGKYNSWRDISVRFSVAGMQ